MNLSELDLTILKTLISNKKHALEFVSECDSKLFSIEAWNIANIIVNYVKTYKDIPTLKVITEKLSKGNNDKLIEYIKNVWYQLDKTQINDLEFRHELEKFKKRFAERELSSIKEKFSKLEPGSIDVSKAVGEMQKTLQSIKSLSQIKSYERKTLKESVPVFREEYNAKMTDPHFDRGIKTGYSYLDFATDGLRPGELLLIGAESGAGKSMLLMNMAVQMWLQENNINTESDWTPGNHVLYFSLEMPFKPCLNRVLSRLSSNPSKKIRNSTLDAEEALRLKKVLKFIKNYPYEFEIIDIPRGATMESLELIYEDVKTHYDPKIIVIDYLGLMSYEGPDMEDWLKLGKIAEKIHEFSRVHNCIVLSAVQLNRAKSSKDSEEKIGLHRVGRSALILQNANIAIQIETRQNEKNYSDMNYYLIKCRDGELGKGKLIKNLACSTLIDDKQPEHINLDIDDISEKIDLLDI